MLGRNDARDQPGRRWAEERPREAEDNRPRGDDGSIAHRHTFEDLRAGPNPNTITDLDRRGWLVTVDGVIVAIGDEDVPGDRASRADPHALRTEHFRSAVQVGVVSNLDPRTSRGEEERDVAAESHPLTENDTRAACLAMHMHASICHQPPSGVVDAVGEEQAADATTVGTRLPVQGLRWQALSVSKAGRRCRDFAPSGGVLV